MQGWRPSRAGSRGRGCRRRKAGAARSSRLFRDRLIADILDALLGGNDLVVARHHRDCAKFQPLRQMHRADRKPAGRDLDLVAQLDGGGAGARLAAACPGAAQFARQSHKHTNSVRLDAIAKPGRNRVADCFGLLLRIIEGLYVGRCAGPLKTETVPSSAGRRPRYTARSRCR